MKRGKIKITYEYLLRLLEIKEGIEIEHISPSQNSRSVDIYLVGSDNNESLLEVEEGHVIPYVCRPL